MHIQYSQVNVEHSLTLVNNAWLLAGEVSAENAACALGAGCGLSEG